MLKVIDYKGMLNFRSDSELFNHMRNPHQINPRSFLPSNLFKNVQVSYLWKCFPA